MKNIKTGTYIHNDKFYNFNFGTDLSTADKQKFVNNVVNLVVDGENYNHILRDLIFDYFTIVFFTDIDTTEFKESSFFVNDVEQFLEETNIVEIIRANVTSTLFEELDKAVNLSIEYRTGIHLNPLNEAFSSLINTLERKISETDLGSMLDVIQNFAGMIGEFTPESIVNAYISSDAHQKKLKEIDESKKQKVDIAKNLDKAIKFVNDEAKAESTK